MCSDPQFCQDGTCLCRPELAHEEAVDARVASTATFILARSSPRGNPSAEALRETGREIGEPREALLRAKNEVT
jgi:hypothetical protein